MAKRQPGRPIKHEEGLAKVMVLLKEPQVHYLDQLALDLRAKTGASVNRAQLIRALITALEESSVDLTKVNFDKANDIEDAIVQLLRRRLR